MSVLVGIPTHKRPDLLRQCLDSIAAQEGDLPTVRVFVADNDANGQEGARLAEEAAAGYRFPISSTVVAEPGISAVRNAILDEARRGRDEFIAMIDDDETASPQWLAELLGVQAEYGADVVGGPSVRESPPEAPNWLHNPEVFGTIHMTTGPVERVNSTSNVLLSCSALDRLEWEQFDLAYGLSGGGDKEYFLRLGAKGASFAWANDSRVYEPIPLSRCTLGYVLRRAFRNGGINRRLHRKYGNVAAPGRRWAVKNLLASPLYAVLAVYPKYRLKALRRIATAAGMLGEDLGYSYFEYAERHGPRSKQPESEKRFNLDSQAGTNWLNRADAAAVLIKRHTARGVRIADLGCGDQKLRAALGDWTSCYRGFDLNPQAPDVTAIDVTSGPLPECDVTVLLGVLEYVPILPVLRKVESPILVVSHLYPDEGALSEELIQKKQWSNLLPKADFERLLEQSGFHIIEVVRTPEDMQHVWLARKRAT